MRRLIMMQWKLRDLVSCSFALTIWITTGKSPDNKELIKKWYVTIILLLLIIAIFIRILAKSIFSVCQHEPGIWHPVLLRFTRKVVLFDFLRVQMASEESHYTKSTVQRTWHCVSSWSLSRALLRVITYLTRRTLELASTQGSHYRTIASGSLSPLSHLPDVVQPVHWGSTPDLSVFARASNAPFASDDLYVIRLHLHGISRLKSIKKQIDVFKKVDWAGKM